MSSIRVVITGLGVISPIGSDLDSLRASMECGRSGIARLESLPTEGLPVRSGAEVKDFTGKIEDYGPLAKDLQRSIKKNMKVMCREIEMGVAAAQKALANSGLGPDRNADRCGCLFGCDYILTRPEEFAVGLNQCREHTMAAGNGAGSSVAASSRVEGSLAEMVAAWPLHGLHQVNPLWLLKYLPNMPNSHISIFNDLRGPNNAITLREASMHLALAEATSIIQRGAADVMLVGATGSRLHPLRTTQVALSEAIASEQPDPTTMSRPFDSSCDGTVLGEGAAAVVLESLEHARARGAKVWGEILGCGAGMVGPSHQEDYLRRAIGIAMRLALQHSGASLGNEWHLHAQGLSSPAQDHSEALAIADLFSELGYSVPVTAAKSYFGNLGAGGAAVELVCSLLALETGRLFPIRNLNRKMASVDWSPAESGSRAGNGFLHASYTLQGQAACVAVGKI